MRHKLGLLAVVVASMLLLLPITAQAQSTDVMPPPGPHGEQCSVDIFNFHGLNNNIHPGEIGLTTTLGCNFTLFALVGHQWLLAPAPLGGWQSINETYAQKGKQNVIAISMTSWYKCGAIDTWESNHLSSKASWDMNFSTNFNTYGAHSTEHWTKCYFPYIVSFN